MAPRLSELCGLLVEEKFGRLAADVFHTLACHGRQVLPQIQYHTRILTTQLKAVLLILITHNILLWHQSDESELPYFQVDWYSAYVLVRECKIARLVEARHGKVARRLLQEILVHGKVEVETLEGEQRFYIGSPRDSGIGMMDEQVSDEGTTKTTEEDQMYTVATFHNTLRLLLEDGFLGKCTARDHVPLAELEDEVRDAVIASDPKTFKDGKITGPRTANLFKEAANDLKRKWQDEAEYSPQRDLASQGTIKRSKNSSQANKRRKVNGDLTDGYPDFDNVEEDDEAEEVPSDTSLRKLPSDMWLRVNSNKCMIALRTERLEKLADQSLGPMSAAVYGGLLRAAEGKIRSVRSQLRVKADPVKADPDSDEDDKPVEIENITIADAEILDRLQSELDLASTVAKESAQKDGDTHDDAGKKSKKRRLEADDEEDAQDGDANEIPSSKGKKRRKVADDNEDEAGNGVKEEVESEDDDSEPIVNGVESEQHRQERLSNIGMHLELIGESPQGFLKRNIQRRTSTISFAHLARLLLDAELDSMILARGGQIGLRIIRILREKGKLLDTQIASICLKSPKEVRVILTNLQALGFLDVQELPRDNTRQPSRTVYLWQFNEWEVRQMFLHQTYQAMTRTLRRKKVEKHRSRDVIEKAESVDWNMQRLNKAEKDLLARWQAVDQRLDVTVYRLDDVAMVLRDFDEADTSLFS